jgi:2-oxoglutarate dehydrogenase E1 component
VQKCADNFPNAEIVWAQEEHRNMGAWTYVDPRIETALRQSKYHTEGRPKYVGRSSSAPTATGDKSVHKREQLKLLNDAFK